MPVTPSPIDSLGCASSALHRDQALAGNGIRFYRKRTDEVLGHVTTPGTDRGFLTGVSMQPGHRRRILHEHHASLHEFNTHSIYLRSFADDYRADLKGPFDFVLMEISRPFFERAVEERAGRSSRTLDCITGRDDPVLSGLAAALAPALERPDWASALFVDQMGVVIGTHLVERYGGGSSHSSKKRRGLSSLHESRAKDMLCSRMNGDVTVAEIADACNLSRSHFIRAFRQSTGQTPHQWLLRYRVEAATSYLRDSQTPLAEIAHLCGFADQSHFTRIFSQLQGTPPGTWRRCLGNQ
jgi:AraC family transcriptional regulator